MKLLALTLSALLLSGCLATESVPEKVLVLAVEDTTIATPLPEPEVLNEEEPDNEKANLEPTPPSEVALEVVSETITPEPMPAPTPMPTPTPSPEPVAPVGQCTVYDNFDTITGVGWQRVNDSVMGGRSLGGFEVQDKALVFAGDINLNGGGFSSFRAGLSPGALNDYSGVKLRVKTDGRGYQLTFRENSWGRISHRLDLNLPASNEWQEVTINFEDLEPAFFGTPVRADAFNKARAGEIGIILNDGNGGPFRLIIDEISFCP